MKKLLALLALTVPAFAGTITQTQTQIVATQSFNSFPSALTFNQFDPSLGTLLDIKFTILGNFTDTTSVTNNTGTTHTYTYSAVTLFSLQDPDGATTNQETPSGSPQHVSVGAGATYTFTGTASGTANSTYNAAGNLTFSNGTPAPDATINIATYLGTGTIVFEANALDTSTASGAVPHATNSTGTAGETITVVYDYSTPPPVTTGTPEPTTMMLLGSALVGIGTWKKFGKKSV